MFQSSSEAAVAQPWLSLVGSQGSGHKPADASLPAKTPSVCARLQDVPTSVRIPQTPPGENGDLLPLPLEQACCVLHL